MAIATIEQIRDDIKKETFIVFLQDNYFNIYEYSHGKYIYRECIPQLCAINFNDLYLLSSDRDRPYQSKVCCLC